MWFRDFFALDVFFIKRGFQTPAPVAAIVAATAAAAKMVMMTVEKKETNDDKGYITMMLYPLYGQCDNNDTTTAQMYEYCTFN